MNDSMLCVQSKVRSFVFYFLYHTIRINVFCLSISSMIVTLTPVKCRQCIILETIHLMQLYCVLVIHAGNNVILTLLVGGLA